MGWGGYWLRVRAQCLAAVGGGAAVQALFKVWGSHIMCQLWRMVDAPAAACLTAIVLAAAAAADGGSGDEMSEDEEADAAAAGGGAGSARRRRGKASEGFKEQARGALFCAMLAAWWLCEVPPRALQLPYSTPHRHSLTASQALVHCIVLTTLAPPTPPPPCAQVLEVLQRHGFLERRAAKMSQDDFLGLLAAFNQAGIHFTS